MEATLEQSIVSEPSCESPEGYNIDQQTESSNNDHKSLDPAPLLPGSKENNVKEHNVHLELSDDHIERTISEGPSSKASNTAEPTNSLQDEDKIYRILDDFNKNKETETISKDRGEEDIGTDILLEAQKASGIVPEDFKTSEESVTQDSPVDPAKNPEIVKCITYSPDPKVKEKTSDSQESTITEVPQSVQFDESQPIIVEITREETSSTVSNESDLCRGKESSVIQRTQDVKPGTKRTADQAVSSHPQAPQTSGFVRNSSNATYTSTPARKASLEQYKEAVYRKDTQGILNASQKIQQEIEEAIALKRPRMEYPPGYHPQQQVAKSYVAQQSGIMVAGEPEKFQRIVREGKAQLITQHPAHGMYQDPRVIPGQSGVQLNYPQNEQASNLPQDQTHLHQRGTFLNNTNSGYHSATGFSNRPGQGPRDMYQTPTHLQNRPTPANIQPGHFHGSQSAPRFPLQQTMAHGGPSGFSSGDFSQMQAQRHPGMPPFSNITRNPNPAASQSNTYPHAPPSYEGHSAPNKVHLDAMHQLHQQQQLIKSSPYPNVNIAEVGVGHGPSNRVPPVTYNRYSNPQTLSYGQHPHLQQPQQQMQSHHQSRMPYPVHPGNSSAIRMQQNIQYQQQLLEQQQRSKMMSAAEKQMYDINRLYPDKQQQAQVSINFVTQCK